MSNENEVDIAPWTTKKILPLPSGAKVRVNNRTIQTLLFAGILPLELLSSIQSVDVQEVMKNPSAGRNKDLMEYWGILFREIIDQPKIVMTTNPGPGEISVADVNEKDLPVLMAYVRGQRDEEALKKIKSFRSAPGGADAGSDVPAVQAAPIGGGGDSSA